MIHSSDGKLARGARGGAEGDSEMGASDSGKWLTLSIYHTLSPFHARTRREQTNLLLAYVKLLRLEIGG